MAVNYIGHFMLSHLLMPQLIAGANKNDKSSRIVNVSSCANAAGAINYDDFHYEKYYHDGIAYANSKLAQVFFTRHFDKLCHEKNWKVRSYAVHPGLVDTEIYKNSIWGSLGFFRKIFWKVSRTADPDITNS